MGSAYTVFFVIFISFFSSLVFAEEYEGWYICSQGKTKLNLTIDSLSGLMMTGVFSFESPDGTKGAFKMSGGYLPDRKYFQLKALEWVDRPANYATVDLTGRFSDDQDSITGSILYPGCSSFKVTRKGGRDITGSTKVTQNSNCENSKSGCGGYATSNVLEYEKIVKAGNSSCKIYVPKNLIWDRLNYLDGQRPYMIDRCRGSNAQLTLGVIEPQMTWSGTCDSNGFAVGINETLTARFNFPTYTSPMFSNERIKANWIGKTVIKGSVKDGHFGGLIYWRIRENPDGDSSNNCVYYENDDVYVHNGQKFETKQEYDEFLNPAQKKPGWKRKKRREKKPSTVKGNFKMSNENLLMHFLH